MKLEQLKPETLSLDYVIKNQYSLYYIIESDSGIAPYKFVSFAKEGLALPTDNYILVKLTKTNEEEQKQSEETLVKTKVSTPRVPKGSRNEYRYTAMNDAGTAKVAPNSSAKVYGGIRISCPSKEGAREYFEYLREQFYDRDIAAVSVMSIYEDIGINKERLERECPDAVRWGYMTLDHGSCKYITTDDVTKNKNDNWFGFTLKAPIIINGLEESGWYAKQRQLEKEEK